MADSRIQAARPRTGRKPGQKDSRSTKRMGLAGAWKTEMHPDLQARFAADFGPVLERAGYEVGSKGTMI